MKTLLCATLVAPLLLVTACGTATGADPASSAKPSPSGSPHPTGKTRTESFADIEVTVPDSWAHSFAPISGDGRLDDCGNGLPRVASVGRPGVTSDVCEALEDDFEPTAPFVWLGVEIADGTRTAGEFTVETRTVAGVPVTVASKDDVERATILDSVVEIDGEDSHGCTADAQGPGGLSTEGLGEVHGMSVCIYHQGTLVASWERGAKSAHASWRRCTTTTGAAGRVVTGRATPRSRSSSMQTTTSAPPGLGSRRGSW